GAVGRCGPRPGHGGRLPRRPDAVRPACDAERARAAAPAPWQPAQLAHGRPVVAAARAAGRLRPGRPGRGGRRAARGALGRGVPTNTATYTDGALHEGEQAWTATGTV